MTEFESATYIASSPIRRQFRLGQGGAGTGQCAGPRQAGEMPAQVATEEIGLVETARQATTVMQRHRHHEIRTWCGLVLQ